MTLILTMCRKCQHGYIVGREHSCAKAKAEDIRAMQKLEPQKERINSEWWTVWCVKCNAKITIHKSKINIKRKYCDDCVAVATRELQRARYHEKAGPAKRCACGKRLIRHTYRVEKDKCAKCAKKYYDSISR